MSKKFDQVKSKFPWEMHIIEVVWLSILIFEYCEPLNLKWYIKQIHILNVSS